MAISTRHSRRPSIDIWPGFVDALAQLLMVIIFILLVFTAGQFYLGEALSGRDRALHALRQQVSQLADMLSLERRANDDLRLGAADLTAQLASSRKEGKALSAKVADLSQKAQAASARADKAVTELTGANATIAADKETIAAQLTQLQTLAGDIKALQEERDKLEAQVAALAASQEQAAQQATTLADQTKQLSAQLAAAQQKNAALQKQSEANLADLGSRAQQAEKALAAEQDMSRHALAEVDTLNAQIGALRQQLAAVAAALDIANTKVKTQQGQITDLGQRLNTALAQQIEQLKQYRSEFFGKVRQIIGNRPGIRIVGDRFVFQAEVLFPPGSATLSDDAKKELDGVFAALKQIAVKIPPNINWILRVDGHTDRSPIDTAQFPSNWELSAERAISVVRLAIAQGIPPNRVAAAGFADTQPIDPGNTPEAYRRDRRIELRLTER
jgi:chemotaxis protein MotB